MSLTVRVAKNNSRMLEVAPYDSLEADACRPENGFGCEVMASLPHVDNEAGRRGIHQWRLDIVGDSSVVTQHGGEHHAGESEGHGEGKGGDPVRCTEYVHMPYLASNAPCRRRPGPHAGRRVSGEPKTKAS